VQLSGVPLLGNLLVLTTNILTRMEMLDWDKHSNLQQTFINYKRKEFYNIGSCTTNLNLDK